MQRHPTINGVPAPASSIQQGSQFPAQMLPGVSVEGWTNGAPQLPLGMNEVFQSSYYTEEWNQAPPQPALGLNGVPPPAHPTGGWNHAPAQPSLGMNAYPTGSMIAHPRDSMGSMSPFFPKTTIQRVCLPEVGDVISQPSVLQARRDFSRPFDADAAEQSRNLLIADLRRSVKEMQLWADEQYFLSAPDQWSEWTTTAWEQSEKVDAVVQRVVRKVADADKEFNERIAQNRAMLGGTGGQRGSGQCFKIEEM